MDLLRKWWNGAGSARAPGDLPIYSDTQHHSSSCGRLSCFEKEVPSTEGYVDQLEFISLTLCAGQCNGVICTNHIRSYGISPCPLGQYGITYSIGWAEPKDPYKPEDIEASERKLQFDAGWFLNPIYINGDYPEVMKKKVAEKSAAQNFTSSRLPPFTEEEKRRINRNPFSVKFYC